MSPKWQYYLDKAMDGKAAGWHDYNKKASERLEEEYLLGSTVSRTTWHLKSGYFKYEINLVNMTQRNMTSGRIRQIRRYDPDEPPHKKARKVKKGKTQVVVPDHGSASLDLDVLFEGAPQEWRDAIEPILVGSPMAPAFVGPKRGKDILPLRELTFQALKPNPPAKWRVICFGQNPYPRVESATGIAMFDATIDSWDSKQFGKASSMRCIIKTAAIAQYEAVVDQKTSIATLRTKLKEWDTVSPMQWFQAMLSQGVLLLNASLSTGGMGKTKTDHVNFWKPVVAKIVETILEAKLASTNQEDKKVIFLWWGADAKKVRKSVVNPILKKYGDQINKEELMVDHIDHCNPAAQGDIFCHDPCHFIMVNQRLQSTPAINWLPTNAWLEKHGNAAHAEFITDTKELHQMYLQRLQDGLVAPLEELEPIQGIKDLPDETLPKSCSSIHLEGPASTAVTKVQAAFSTIEEALSIDEKAAVYLYTGNSLYRKLNEALRNPDRSKIQAYRPYLRQFLSAFDKMRESSSDTKKNPDVLYRGLNKDISAGYPVGSAVTWWNVNSTTPNKSVACSFGGSHGTLIQIYPKTAVPIMHLSAYQHEEEYVLAPGTRFQVVKNTPKTGTSASVITLEEIDGERLVN